jgi:hypothetical protein
MTSGLTSPARPWFKLGSGDPELDQIDSVRYWLDDVQGRMMTTFAKSNIYGELHSCYAETGGFGTGALIILDDFKTTIRARTFTAGEYFLGIGPDGRADTFGRQCWFTVGQVVKQFGIERVSPSVKSLWENGSLEQWVKLSHLIEPNDKRLYGKQDFKNMPYRSVYWEEGSPSDTYLAIAGFEEFPVLAPRWDLTTALDSYGKGPGWESLGDVKMLQKMQLDKLIALDKLVDPPIQVDASVQGEANMLPGGITRSSAQSPNAGVRAAYQIDPHLDDLEASIRSTQGAIREAFYSDLFLMLANTDRSNMTAREVAERHEEKLLMLGPVIERLEGDLLDPLIDRTFSIMLRKGQIPEPPQELQGMDLKVEYISILAQAQRMVGTTSIEKIAGFAGNLAAVQPDVLDVIDFDEALIEYGTMLGVPPKVVRSHEAIKVRRAQKAQAAQAQAQAADMGAMVQGAKVLSDTPVGGNSALDHIIGTVGQAQQGGAP